jgi:alpha-galactosidase
MDRPDLGEGMVAAFRRKDSPFVTACFCLQGLDKDVSYQIENIDTGTTRNVKGQTLMETGLTVEIASKPGTTVIVYSVQRQRLWHKDERSVK